ncbi:MAG TPA: 5'-methylthioadenosine/S-adenosylhomocysteine nucleosidase [Xanthobacteraceae bacterium]|jgi:nucleoside phosphorylase|nr:5'-methylthioadenosine/S-adenosylhomocysteine nucleosidase [Xanthobacteraceae bacterium]
MNTPLTAAIFTALEKEYLAVRKYVRDLEDVRVDGYFYEGGYYTAGSSEWRILLCLTGPGNTAAGIAVEKLVSAFDPDVTFFCGIAGGLKDVKLGDVVVGETVYFYDNIKEEREVLPRPTNTMQANVRLVQAAKAAGRSLTLENEKNNEASAFRVFVKPIAAGAGLLANKKGRTAEFVRRYYGDAVALEMEGSGYMISAHMNERPALVIRGISDLLSGKSTADAKGSQETAATNAAAFLFRVFMKLDIETFQRPKKADVPTLEWSQVLPILNTMYRRIEALFPPDVILTMSGSGSIAALYCMGLRPNATPVLVCVTFPLGASNNKEVVAFCIAAEKHRWIRLQTDKWLIFVPSVIESYSKDANILLFDDRVISGASQKALRDSLTQMGFRNVKCAAMIWSPADLTNTVDIEFKGQEIAGHFYMPWGSNRGRS